MRRFLSAMLAALILLTLSACGGTSPAASSVPAEGSASSAPAASAPDPLPEPVQVVMPEEAAALAIEDLLSSMTTEQKVGQLFFARCPAENAAGDAAAYHLGGYILFGRDTRDKPANELIQTIAGYQAAARSAGDPGLLIGVDEEGGTVVRVSSNPHLRSARFQSPQKVWAKGGEEAVIADTREKDRLLQALGFNVNLAPVADVSTDPGDFIYPRTLGQDAEMTADYVFAVTETMALDGMGSVLKHFPGYGNNVDTHTGVARDTRPMEAFTSADFLPFRMGMAAGYAAETGQRAAVLVSHNIVECMDPDLPASLSPAVHEILRQELRFTGVVMTDDLAMDAVAAYAADGSAAVLAIQAGNDLLITSDHRTQIPQVLSAIEAGELDINTVNDACRRVLAWKQTLGLL